MRLHETVKDMISKDYKERLRAEYQQLCIRCDDLKSIIDAALSGERVDLNCPIELLMKQECTMEMYLDILQQRMDLEDISF